MYKTHKRDEFLKLNFVSFEVTLFFPILYQTESQTAVVGATPTT